MRTVRIKILHQYYKYFGVLSLIFFVLCIWYSTSNAEKLQGKIIGVDNKPKQFASVSIFGAENRRTQTNEKGDFSVDLPPGFYVMRIWQKPKRQELNFQIAPGLNEPQPCKVEW